MSVSASPMFPFLIAFALVVGGGLAITGVDRTALTVVAGFMLGIGSGYWLERRRESLD